ncbi:MAG: DUF4140 domain-containing protein [Tannerellaceae bacterium]|nr:DUF4140 domain-containing protein [Tannerellaceae bacterium]
MKTSDYSVVLILISLFSLPLKAQDKITLGSKLSEATVFFKGAELTHSATANLVKGENEIYIEGLSPGIDLNSLKIKSPAGVVVSSYEYSVDYLTASKPSASYVRKIEDSITVYQDRLDRIEIENKINREILKYLQEGITKNISGSESGLGIDELVKTIEYYKSKSEEAETLLKSLEKEKRQSMKLLPGSKHSGTRKI